MTKEDIRILLSYVPFHTEEETKDSLKFETHSSNSRTSGHSEGLYRFRAENTFNKRLQDQGEINSFLDQVFAEKISLTFKEYIAINQEVSSEMFFSMMRVLHDHLPCTKNFYI